MKVKCMKGTATLGNMNSSSGEPSNVQLQTPTSQIEIGRKPRRRRQLNAQRAPDDAIRNGQPVAQVDVFCLKPLTCRGRLLDELGHAPMSEDAGIHEHHARAFSHAVSCREPSSCRITPVETDL